MSLAIVESILDLVGRTPMLRLNKIKGACPADLLAKLEMFNPSGSSKARAALGMILSAERKGLIDQNTVIIEPTSGNQGIALAMVGAVRGYRTVVVMPESMSEERRLLAQAYGAEVVLTPAGEDVGGAVKKARELVLITPGGWMPNQFANPANPQFHEETTALEILEQVPGNVDALVAGVGTGGTLTGVARILKRKFKAIKIYAVEPAGSAVLSGEPAGSHSLQGIGDGFVPANLDLSLVDFPIKVEDDEAMSMTRRLAREEGLLVGISSGAAAVAALKVGFSLGAGHTILTVFPDTGERYLSTPVFRQG